MKNLIYIVLLSFAPMFAFSQVYVKAPDGDVGVGTDTPIQKLDVNGNLNVRGDRLNFGQDAGATAAFFRVGYNRTANGTAAIDCIGTLAYPSYGFRFGHTGAGNSIMFHRGTNPFVIQNSEAAHIYIKTNNAHRMAIMSDGRVGIGTTNPDASTLLDVKGAIGYNGTLTNTSDKRLKANEQDFNYGLKEVLALSPIYYSYNGKAGTSANQTHVGIYAQDLRKVAPELVSEFKYEETEVNITEKGDEIIVTESLKSAPQTYLNINESSIKYMLINAVKEQQNEIESLREEVADLKEIVNALINQNTNINRQNIQLDGSGTYLEQNQPNPFNSNTLIKYRIPTDATDAVVNIFDVNGQLIHSEVITNTGKGEIQLKAGTIAAGTYSYSLVVNGNIVDTKRMVIVK